MAKQKRKQQRTRAEAVRSAVEQAFESGQSQFTRERAQEIVDDLTAAAGRVREALDELRPPSGDEVKGLQTQIRALERRVNALEGKRTPARRASSSKPRTASTRSGAGAKRKAT